MVITAFDENLTFSKLTPFEKNGNFKELVQTKLDFSKWELLRKSITAYDPHVVVLLARKMPRLYELFEWKEHFGNKIVVSDFAIPFIASKITPDMRIAIVDDTYNHGTTVENLYNKLSVLTKNIEIFVLGKAITAAKNNTCVQKNEYGFKTILPNNTSLFYVEEINKIASVDKKSDYEVLSHQIPSSIAFIAKPYEIEFPIFCTSYRDTELDALDIFDSLKEKLGGDVNVHDTTALDMVKHGLARISIDFDVNNSECNKKIRLYLDDINKKVSIVPMYIAHNYNLQYFEFDELKYTNEIEKYYSKHAKQEDAYKLLEAETKTRWIQFFASLNFGFEILEKLDFIFDIDSSCISSIDLSMLFGADFSEKLEKLPYNELKALKLPTLYSQSENSTLALLRFSKKLSETEKNNKSFIDSLLFEKKDRDSIFLSFFKEVETQKLNDSTHKYSMGEDYFPSNSQVEKFKFLKLRVGPTFNDMLVMFKKLWTDFCPCIEYSDKNCRALLSSILDGYVDDGCIVPVISLDGNRIYRTGEAPQYNRIEYNATKAYYDMYINKKVAYPWDYDISKTTDIRGKEVIAEMIDNIMKNN